MTENGLEVDLNQIASGWDTQETGYSGAMGYLGAAGGPERDFHFIPVYRLSGFVFNQVHIIINMYKAFFFFFCCFCSGLESMVYGL